MLGASEHPGPDPVVVHTASEGLTLYTFIPKAEQPLVAAEGCLRMKRAGRDAWRIGLRTSVQDALDRASHFNAHVSKHTHCVLQIHFSSLGLAYYTTTTPGSDFNFKPTLYKKQFNDRHNDWGVWHFLGDMPLNCVDGSGNFFIASTWLDIQ